MTQANVGSMPSDSLFPTRSEPAERHEPSMLDKLEGAELADGGQAGDLVAVRVVDVRFASAMWRNGLRPDDVIIGLDRHPISTVAQLTTALGKVGWGFTLTVIRDGHRLKIAVP